MMRKCCQMRKDMKCVCVICISLSMFAVFLLSYMTSYELQTKTHMRRVILGGLGEFNSRGNTREENSIQIVEVVDTSGKKYRLDSFLDSSQEDSVELHFGSKNKVVTSATTDVQTTHAQTTTPHGWIQKNCTGIQQTSELLQTKTFQFLANYKNPCWHEPLRQVKVYSRNRFSEFSRYSKLALNKLEEEWAKRISNNPYPRRLRCLPYFFIAGQPKCGSTDLYQKLTSHPDVVTPPIKEPHWWGKNRYGWRLNYTTAIPLTDYIDLFDRAALMIEHVVNPLVPVEDGAEPFHQVITGDASVSTLWDSDDWWRLDENCGRKEPLYTNADYIHHFLPNAKIIVILRDPTERLYSDYLYFQKSRKSAEDFHLEVTKAINGFEACLGKYTQRSCIYNRTVANLSKVRLRIGLYYEFIKEWLKVYPLDQMLIIRLDDYARDTRLTLQRVFNFLGLSANSTVVDYGSRKHKRSTAYRNLAGKQITKNSVW
ncbi:carbohydrate sulfotransferase 15-like isoform X2 [Gigantopelta aegis]|uniref:carbohydrate sulfotransferase 15-like isoform X2 n=1 Tax=Gigantopelta aegis TaxID=1735272 RepID=UPI001B889A02|nr:carbohydrate sulfotransferase 15-like isoform X2 [Gigantopelta aegis]